MFKNCIRKPKEYRRNKSLYNLKMSKNFSNKRKKFRKQIQKPAIETKISSSGMTEENLELLGLRLKMLAVDCGKHAKWRVFKKVPNYVYYTNNLNYEVVKAHNIYEYLSVSTFEHYSSIIIFVNCQNARCRRKSLDTIIKAIRRNKRIRNQLKLIWTSYKGYSHAFTPDILFDSMFKDFFTFKSNKLENTVLFQDHFEREIQVLLHLLTAAPFTSAQEIQQILKCQYLLIQLKSTADLYFYGVNPALAIIVNNYFFTNNEVLLETREGSENDVMDLIHTFTVTRTPYVVINDISRDQLLGWKDYLCRKDMTNLENLYFVTMTHGSSNDIIYTNDGQVNFIEDILRPIQANTTLKKTNIAFINVHCRGDVLANTADPDVYEDIPRTVIEHLPTNISIMFSVPNSMISPRDPKKGTPVIKGFSKIFCNLDSSSNIKILHDKIWNHVKKDPYYEYLDIFEKSTDLVVGNYDHDGGNGNKNEYNIKPIPSNPKQILSLFSSIGKDCTNMDLKCKIQKQTDNDLKSFCLYTNVNKKEYGMMCESVNESTDNSDDNLDEDSDEDLDESSDDITDDDSTDDKRKMAEIEFRKLILPFMGSTILQDEMIFALDGINKDDEDTRDDFGTAILDYRTLIKAFDYELGIAVEHY